MTDLSNLTRALHSSSSSTEKQGNLGDLYSKSVPELRQLLERQTHLLQRQRRMLDKLPDKGAKVRSTIELIERVLKEKTSVENMTELFERTSVNAEDSQSRRTMDRMNDDDSEEIKDLLATVINKPDTDKVVLDESDLERPLTNQAMLNKAINIEAKTKNTLESNRRQTFHPNESLRQRNVQEITRNLAHGSDLPATTQTTDLPVSKTDTTSHFTPSPTRPGKTLQGQSSPSTDKSARLKYRYDETLEKSVYGGSGRSTQLIDVQSAMDLEQQLSQQTQKLHIQQTMDKLLLQFHVDQTPCPDMFSAGQPPHADIVNMDQLPHRDIVNMDQPQHEDMFQAPRCDEDDDTDDEEELD